MIFTRNFYIVQLLQYVTLLVSCDWVEIPHITKNSHSYPEENFKSTFLKLKTTHATLATTPISKRIYTKEILTDVLERPPYIKANQIAQNNKVIGVQNDRTKTNNNLQKTITNNENYDDKMNENENYGDKMHENENYGDLIVEQDYDDATENIYNENVENSNQNNSDYTEFLPLLKNIQDSLIKTSQSSTKDKINVLQDLRDNLLYNLKEKIATLWTPTRDKRSAREHKEEHHMDYSSNEGPLMTIGFLTFAVFLIKLVLQLINALKAKQSLYMIPATTTTTAATLLIGRRKRSEDINVMTSDIMNLIDQYKLKTQGI